MSSPLGAANYISLLWGTARQKKVGKHNFKVSKFRSWIF